MSDEESKRAVETRWSIIWSVTAFAAILALYALASGLFLDALAPPFGTPAPKKPLDLVAYELSTYWAALSICTDVVCAALTIWSLAILRQYLQPRALWAMRVMLAIGVVGVLIPALGKNGGTMRVPQALTCDSPRLIETAHGFLCGYNLSTPPDTLFSSRDWVQGILHMRVLGNALFSVAAFFIAGTIFALAVACRTGAPVGRPEKLVENKVVVRLFMAAATVFSLRILSEIVFCNWPIAAMAGQAVKGLPDPGKAMTGILTAYIFYFAVLGSLVMVLVMWFAMAYGFRTIKITGAQTGIGWPTSLPKALELLTRESTLKVLMALSPILTAVIGSPIVTALLKGGT